MSLKFTRGAKNIRKERIKCVNWLISLIGVGYYVSLIVRESNLHLIGFYHPYSFLCYSLLVCTRIECALGFCTAVFPFFLHGTY